MFGAHILIIKKKNTDASFQKLNVLTLNQLYNKTSIVKIYMNQTVFECLNMYKTRGINNGGLRSTKPNKSLMDNFNTNRGITLFNQLPYRISN